MWLVFQNYLLCRCLKSPTLKLKKYIELSKRELMKAPTCVSTTLKLSSAHVSTRWFGSMFDKVVSGIRWVRFDKQKLPR